MKSKNGSGVGLSCHEAAEDTELTEQKEGMKTEIYPREEFACPLPQPWAYCEALVIAPVAQLDRVTVSEAVGCGFDPRRVHQIFRRRAAFSQTTAGTPSLLNASVGLLPAKKVNHRLP